MARIKVSVTADDIATGSHGIASACPVANAIYRRTGYFTMVGDEGIDIYPRAGYPRAGEVGGRFVTLNPSDRVRDFVHRFDEGQRVQPFAFYIDFPDDWQLLPDRSAT